MVKSRAGNPIELGMNTCFAVKRWPEPEQWAAIVAEFDLKIVQMSVDLLPMVHSGVAARRHIERVRRAVEANGLSLHSLFTGLAAYSSSMLLSDDADDRRAAEEWYRWMITLAGAAGATGFGGHVGAFSVPSAADESRRHMLMQYQLDAMHRLAEHAAAEGLDHLQFENLAVRREPGHSIPEAHAMESALAGTAVPWRLCLDVGHPPSLPAVDRSSQPGAWVTEAWLNTPVVQLQQSPLGADQHGPFTAAANENGAVDRDVIIDAIREWDAEVVPSFFEIIHAHEAPDDVVLQELATSVEYWRTGLIGHLSHE
jgi:sugar phosphate isomerase/epimerase